MAKFSKEELSSRINDLEIDEAIKIALIEDITDSIMDDSKYQELEEKYTSKEKEYDELYSKYKERFFASNDKVDDVSQTSVKECQEPEVIDVKEIF